LSTFRNSGCSHFDNAAPGKAKGKAQAIACVNNLKQLGLCWFMYAGDNNDRLVLNDYLATTPDTSWITEQRYLGQQPRLQSA